MTLPRSGPAGQVPPSAVPSPTDQYDGLDDRGLVARVTEGDGGALEALYRRYGRPCYGLARRILADDQFAQDVVQDALMRAMRYMGSLRLESARPWLLQIVRHTCYTWLKENRPQEKVLLDEPEDAWRDLADASSAEPPAIAIRKAEREQINAAIAALPVGYREVFVLRELEELAYNDIARIAETERVMREVAAKMRDLIPGALLDKDLDKPGLAQLARAGFRAGRRCQAAAGWRSRDPALRFEAGSGPGALWPLPGIRVRTPSLFR